MTSNLTVYKASAGSGKTFTLTAEYVALILDGTPAAHRAILAVTFTNKATAEMKMRILQELWDLAYGSEGLTDFKKAVMERLPGVDGETLRHRAKSALHAIVHDYDYFRIQTIDSFFQSILSTLAHELKLSAGFRVEINDAQVIDGAVDNLIETLYKRDELRRWVMNYIDQRIEQNESWDVTGEVKRLARLIMKDVFIRNEKNLLKVLDSEEEVKAFAGQLHAIRRNELKELETHAADFHTRVEAVGGYTRISRGGNIEKFVNKIANGIFEEVSESMQGYMCDATKWVKTADRKNADFCAAVEELREALGAFYQKSLVSASICNSCEITLRFINPLRLIGEIEKRVEAINKENNRFMLTRTPYLFAGIIKNEDASFVFEKAAMNLKHVMIDEFQDTSMVQWENFRTLLLENMAQGNSCLLVGDVKQSIYRFRNGDWKILGNIKKYFPRHPVSICNLDVNYRSAQEIIGFNNRLFAEAAVLLDTKDSANSHIADLYDDVVQQCTDKPGGRVEVRFLDAPASNRSKNKTPDFSAEEQEASEDADVCTLMAERMLELNADGRGVPFSKMAILVQRNYSATRILNTFTQAGYEIPLVSDEAFLLSSSPAVLTLVNALQYLVEEAAPKTDDKNNKTSVSLAYIAAAYRRLVDKDNAHWDEMAEDWMACLPEAFRKDRSRLLEMPLYELCERIVRDFRLDAMPNAAPYLFFFLDEVMTYLDSGVSEIEAFLDYWGETLSSKSIPAGEIDGVRILTIHKSKGLAFHTVFVPYCDWYLDKDKTDSLMWFAPNVAPFSQLSIVPVKPDKQLEQSVYADAYRSEHQDCRTENLNLMYVAFTRAKQNLFVWAKVSEKIKSGEEGAFQTAQLTMGDVLYTALGGEEYVVDGGEEKKEISNDKEADPNPFKVGNESEPVGFVAHSPRVDYRQSNSAKDFLADEESLDLSYIDIGKLMHHVLSQIQTLDDVDDALGELRRSGVLADEKDRERLSALLKKRLQSPVARDWFSGRWSVYNETTIMHRTDKETVEIPRPDRVMTDGDDTVVIDFKFAKEDAAHSKQVEDYCHLLLQMGYRRVKGYLWYMYTGKIVEVCNKEREYEEQ